jgi:hypothetical protein
MLDAWSMSSARPGEGSPVVATHVCAARAARSRESAMQHSLQRPARANKCSQRPALRGLTAPPLAVKSVTVLSPIHAGGWR